MYTYESARRRVDAEPELQAHRATILYPWREGDEHWRWVCESPVPIIARWAALVETVLRDEAERLHREAEADAEDGGN